MPIVFRCRVCRRDLASDLFSPSERRAGRARCRECSRGIQGRVRSCCKDCGTTDGMSWWIERGYVKSGTHSARCHRCYLANTARRQSGPTAGNRGRTFGPPKPYVSKATSSHCSECGAEFRRTNVSVFCPDCRVAHEAARRDVSSARRLLALRKGDRSIHWLPLGERDHWRCHICGRKVAKVAGGAKSPMGATVDHLIPVAMDGEHVWSNVALAHRRCNLSRRAGGRAQLRLIG